MSNCFLEACARFLEESSYTKALRWCLYVYFGRQIKCTDLGIVTYFCP